MTDGGQSGGNNSDMNWDTILQPLLSQYGHIINYANLLVITDVPDRFKLIDQVISEIDKPIPEVMLEVEFKPVIAQLLRASEVRRRQRRCT